VSGLNLNKRHLIILLLIILGVVYTYFHGREAYEFYHAGYTKWRIHQLQPELDVSMCGIVDAQGFTHSCVIENGAIEIKREKIYKTYNKDGSANVHTSSVSLSTYIGENSFQEESARRARKRYDNSIRRYDGPIKRAEYK